jgi:hypothetical protein
MDGERHKSVTTIMTDDTHVSKEHVFGVQFRLGASLIC